MWILALTGIFFKWLPKLFEWFYKIHWIFLIVTLVYSKLHGPDYAFYVGGGCMFADFII